MKIQDLLNKPTMTVGQLSKKYHTAPSAVETELSKGVKVEMEHTNNIQVAREIALDHLGEDLYYYDKLSKIEKPLAEALDQYSPVGDPTPSELKLLARRNKYHSARFVVYKPDREGTTHWIAADSEHFTHHSMAPAMGAWLIRGYVQYLGDNEYAYRSMEVYSPKTVDHPLFRTWERAGIQNGNPEVVESYSSHLKESAIDLSQGGRAVKDLRVEGVVKMARKQPVRGLVFGRHIYWWPASNATHGEVAAQLGFTDYVDYRLMLSKENDELRLRGDPVEIQQWMHHVKACPQLNKLTQSDQLYFHAGSHGWVTGAEFIQIVSDEPVSEAWSKKYKKSINCANPKGFSQRAHCAGRKARSAHRKTKSTSVSEATTRTSKQGAPGTLKAKISGKVTCDKVQKLKHRRNATPHDVSQANWFINMHNCEESVRLSEIFQEPAQPADWKKFQHGKYTSWETEFYLLNKLIKVEVHGDYNQTGALFVTRNTDLDLPKTYQGYQVIFRVAGSTEVTGEMGASAAKVFEDVVSVFRGFFDTHDWDYILFTGQEGSRDSLYDRIAQRLARQVGAKVATYRSEFLIYKPGDGLAEQGGVGLVVPGVNMPAGMHPDEIRRQARKFGFKTTKDGVPPVTRTDGKY